MKSTNTEAALQVTSSGDAWRLTIEQYQHVEDGSFGAYEQLPDAEIHVGVMKDECPGPAPLPEFADTCCGHCGPGLCYVDQMTGA